MMITLTSKTEYVPEWRENKKDPNPIVVEHKVPTMALKDRLIPKAKLKVIVSPDGKSEGGESEIVVDNSNIVNGMITGFKNFTINVDGKEIQIKKVEDITGKDAPAIFGELVDELGTYFQKLLNEKADSKN